MVTDWPWLSYEPSGGIALFMNALATTHKSVKLLHTRAREPYFLSRKLSSSLKNTALRLARRQCPEGIVEGHKSRSRSCFFFFVRSFLRSVMQKLRELASLSQLHKLPYLVTYRYYPEGSRKGKNSSSFQPTSFTDRSLGHP